MHIHPVLSGYGLEVLLHSGYCPSQEIALHWRVPRTTRVSSVHRHDVEVLMGKLGPCVQVLDLKRRDGAVKSSTRVI